MGNIISNLSQTGDSSDRRDVLPKVDVGTDRIIFWTHMGSKLTEVQKLMGTDKVQQMWEPGLETYELDADLDLADLALKRVQALFVRLGGKPCFLEEASLVIDGTGFPGHCFRDIVNNPPYFRQWVQDNNGKHATIRLCVGFIGRDGVPRSFEATQRGVIRVVNDAIWKTPGAAGWDFCFAPLDCGGQKVVAEMMPQKHFVCVRLQLYLTFRELIEPKSEGCFEIHITVVTPDWKKKLLDADGGGTIDDVRSVVAKFQMACAKYNLRPLIIFEEMKHDDDNNEQHHHDGGKRDNCQLQLQTAIYRAFPSLKDVSQYAYETSKNFEAEGFKVVRTRAEAMAHSPTAPQTDAEAVAHHGGSYFETHRRAGVNLPAEQIKALKEIAVKHSDERTSFHVSTVGPKTFLNCRRFRMGVVESDRRFKACESDMEKAGVKFVKKAHCEFCVMDDDVGLDHRGLSDPNPSACIVRPDLYDAYSKYLCDEFSAGR